MEDVDGQNAPQLTLSSMPPPPPPPPVTDKDEGVANATDCRLTTLVTNTVRAVAVHFMSRVIVNYRHEICYGCETEHPSQIHHPCLEEAPEYFYSKHYQQLNERLRVEKLIPAICKALAARSIRVSHHRIWALLDSVLDELKSCPYFKAKVIDRLVGDDCVEMELIKEVDEVWQETDDELESSELSHKKAQGARPFSTLLQLLLRGNIDADGQNAPQLTLPSTPPQTPPAGTPPLLPPIVRSRVIPRRLLRSASCPPRRLFGSAYCHQTTVLIPESGDDYFCESSAPPPPPPLQDKDDCVADVTDGTLTPKLINTIKAVVVHFMDRVIDVRSATVV